MVEDYKKLFNNINDPVLVNSYDGNFLYVNNAAERFIGYSGDEWHSINLKDIFLSESREEIKERKKRLENEKKLIFESEIITNDGKKFQSK